MITAALPTFNNSQIIWVQLTALCNQINAPEWELIVCEEESENMLGAEGLTAWRERLKAANCKRISYIKLDKWAPLGQKWVIIRDNMHPDSVGMMLCASDNYSPSDRIAESFKAMQDGVEWFQWNEGHFYNILDHRAGTYRTNPGNPALFMCASTEALKRVIAKSFPRKGVDTWLKKHTMPQSYRLLGMTEGVHTDGFNTISHKRRHLYEGEGSGQFEKADPDEVFKLFPKEVQDKLTLMRRQ